MDSGQMIERVMALLGSPDQDLVRQGAELAAGCGDPAVLAAVQRGISVEGGGLLWGLDSPALHPSLEYWGILQIARSTGLLDELERLSLPAIDEGADLSPLAGLPALRELYVRGGAPGDLSALSTLPALERLELHTIRARDLGGLAGATGLRALEIAHCGPLIDVSALAGLTALEEVVLGDCAYAMSDLSAFSRLPALRLLRLDGVRAGDLESLAGATALEELALTGGYSPPRTLAPLAGLTALRVLDLCCGAKTAGDHEALAQLTRLESLTLYGDVSKLNALASMTSLRELALPRAHEIGSLAPLAGLVGLERLALGGLRGGDLSVVAALPALEDLLLDKPGPELDLSPLRGASRLVEGVSVDAEGHLSRGGARLLDAELLLALHIDGPHLQGVRHVAFEGSWQLHHAACFSGLTELETAKLPWTSALWDASRLERLERLELGGLGGGDLSSLAALPALRALDLGEVNARVDLSALRGMSRLVEGVAVDPEGYPVRSGARLRGNDLWIALQVDGGHLAGLRHLVFDRGVSLRDLDRIAGLTDLEALDLSALRGLSDNAGLIPLEKLRSLRYPGYTSMPVPRRNIQDAQALLTHRQDLAWALWSRGDRNPAQEQILAWALDRWDVKALALERAGAAKISKAIQKLLGVRVYGEDSQRTLDAGLALLGGFVDTPEVMEPIFEGISLAPDGALAMTKKAKRRKWVANQSDYGPRPELWRALRVAGLLDGAERVTLGWDPRGARALAGLASLRALTIPAIFDDVDEHLAPLADLPALEELEIQHLGAMPSRAGLANAPGLRALRLSNPRNGAQGPADLSALAALPELEALSLRDVLQLRDLSPLVALPQLRELEIAGCPRADLSALAGMSRLVEGVTVDAEGHPSRNGERLTGGALLVALHVDGDHLQGARHLAIQGAALTDLSRLAGLTALETLSLQDCPSLADASALAGLDALVRLEVSGCPTLRPRPRRKLLDGAEAVATYRAKLTAAPALRKKKKTTARARTAAVRKQLGARDPEVFAAGLDALLALSPAEAAPLAEGLSLDGEGRLCLSVAASRKGHLRKRERQAQVGWRALRAAGRLDGARILHATLADLSPLAGLAALERLTVTEAHLDAQHLSALPALTHLTGSAPDGLEGLAGLTGLESLTVEAHGADLSPLAALTALRSLSLTYAERLTDLSPLTALPALGELALDTCEALTDLSPLAELPALESLTLESVGARGAQAIAAISSASGLKRLRIAYCGGLRDLRPLAGLAALEELEIDYGSDLESWQGAEALTRLRALRTRYVNGGDLSPLAGLTALETLRTAGWRLSDLSPLAGLTGLRSLELGAHRGTPDLSPLAGLTALTTLALNGASEDLSPLAGLTALTALDLSGCSSARSVAPLAGLTALTALSLDLAGGDGDLSALAGLTALAELSLAQAPGVLDLGPLAGLTGLRRLRLRAAPGLGDLGPLAGLTALEELEIDGAAALRDLSPLAGLASLRTLTLDGCRALSDATPLTELPALSMLKLGRCDGLGVRGRWLDSQAKIQEFAGR